MVLRLELTVGKLNKLSRSDSAEQRELLKPSKIALWTKDSSQFVGKAKINGK